MTILLFTLVLLAGAMLAGFLGSLTGLGGAVIIIPLLNIVFKIDIHYAIGTSLIAVIGTSSGSAAAYVKEGITNIRLGMFLEIATTIGAVIGSFLIVYTPANIITVIFGFVLIFSAVMTVRKKVLHVETENRSKLASMLRLNSNFPDKGEFIDYKIRRVPAGFVMMAGAGVLSSLLGIGSGAFKVLAMDNVMRIPFKVSTTTSNFMIGVTAAASTAAYFHRGYIDPVLTFPVVVGVLMGSIFGSKVLIGANTSKLRIVFAVVISAIAIEMIYKGLHSH